MGYLQRKRKATSSRNMLKSNIFPFLSSLLLSLLLFLSVELVTENVGCFCHCGTQLSLPLDLLSSLHARVHLVRAVRNSRDLNGDATNFAIVSLIGGIVTLVIAVVGFENFI